jgi:hypothetical protein
MPAVNFTQTVKGTPIQGYATVEVLPLYYEAPYGAWDQNGPRGPGYYLPNGDQLNPVSRS